MLKMSEKKGSSPISEKDLKRNNIDIKSENRKMVGKLYLYQILAVIINLLFYLTMSMLVNNFATKQIGERTIERLENGETRIVGQVDYDKTTTAVTTTTTTVSQTTGTGESTTGDTTAATTAETLPSNQYIEPIRTEMSPTVRVVSETIFQIIMIIVIIALIYSPLWAMGDKDSNRIKFNRIKNDKYRGFKIGLFAGIPVYLWNFLLILAKIGIIPNYVVFYRLLNNTYMPLVNAFAGTGKNDISKVSVAEVIILCLFVVVIPLASHIGYTLGLKHISLTEKFIYVNPNKKKKPRRY